MLFGSQFSSGAVGSRAVVGELSNSEPHRGGGSLTRGGPSVEPTPEYVLPLIDPLMTPVYPVPVGLYGLPGCLTHWVSPDWPAIMAAAFGVDGVSSVAKMLSNSVKRLAYRQKKGIVSQSMCAMTRRANCVPCFSPSALPALA